MKFEVGIYSISSVYFSFSCESDIFTSQLPLLILVVCVCSGTSCWLKTEWSRS